MAPIARQHAVGTFQGNIETLACVVGDDVVSGADFSCHVADTRSFPALFTFNSKKLTRRGSEFVFLGALVARCINMTFFQHPARSGRFARSPDSHHENHRRSWSARETAAGQIQSQADAPH